MYENCSFHHPRFNTHHLGCISFGLKKCIVDKNAFATFFQVQNVLYCIYYKGTQSNKHVQGKRQDKANRMYQNELHTNTWAANNTLEGVHELIHLQMIYRYIFISVHTQDAAMHACMRTYAHACMYTHMNVWCMQAHSQASTYKETLILQIYMLDKIYTCNIYG